MVIGCPTRNERTKKCWSPVEPNLCNLIVQSVVYILQGIRTFTYIPLWHFPVCVHNCIYGLWTLCRQCIHVCICVCIYLCMYCMYWSTWGIVLGEVPGWKCWGGGTSWGNFQTCIVCSLQNVHIIVLNDNYACTIVHVCICMQACSYLCIYVCMHDCMYYVCMHV